MDSYSTSNRIDTMPSASSVFTANLTTARSGNPVSVGFLLEHYRFELLGFATRFLPDDVKSKCDPDDLVQEALVRASLHFPKFQGQTESQLKAWLSKILKRQIINFVHSFRHSNKRRLSMEQSWHKESAVGPEAIAPGSTPSSHVSKQEEISLVLKAVEALPPVDRDIFNLHWKESRSFAEIAAILHIKEGTARKRWQRTCERLRALNVEPAALSHELIK
jgi:RNA polymerase sigma-70 factor (subfamily 1)